MSYKPLRGSNDFNEVFKNPSQKVDSEHFRALTFINNKEFKLGMILPKKNIKLAVQRNFIKRTVRNLSSDVFSGAKISLVLVSKKRVLHFKKDKLKKELKDLIMNHKIKLNEENNHIFN